MVRIVVFPWFLCKHNASSQSVNCLECQPIDKHLFSFNTKHCSASCLINSCKHPGFLCCSDSHSTRGPVFIQPSTCLLVTGCLHIPQPNWPLYWLILKNKALAGRSGTTDQILHTGDTSTPVSLLKLLPFAKLNNSLVKCFTNSGTFGLD